LEFEILSDFYSKLNFSFVTVKLITKPNDAIYEASVFYDLKIDRFQVKIGDISRINKYGQQANCIYLKNPELRKFCSCKENLN
jgi:hypothetical protein